MSKIGKQPVIITEKVAVQIKGRDILIKGVKGELSYSVNPAVKIETDGKKITLSIAKPTKEAKSLWGTTRMIIDNMVKGVSEGFEKKLEIQGIGYKAVLQGKNKIILSVGFTHPVELEAPSGIEFKSEKNIITVSGIDKQKVGQVAAEIRAVKPPEPYLGKGIRYAGEIVKRKAGKKVAAATK
jgi:large subunit ribosomal protein L6